MAKIIKLPSPMKHSFFKIYRSFLSFSVGLFILLLFLVGIWLRGGLESIYFDTDLGRDLYEMSNIITNKYVWLGPRLSYGFPASPIYYYFFFPFLFLARWDANALIVTNVVFAALALGLFGILSWKKQGIFALILVAAIGLSPWWRNMAIHPGNGYTYAIWLFLSLVSMWNKFPLGISALLLGIAISFHPAALFGVPILLYEWWRRKHSVFQCGIIIIGLLLPWTPIIVFEFITRGSLIRDLIAHPSKQLASSISLSLINIRQLAALLGLGSIAGTLFWTLTGYWAHQRPRMWFYVSILSFLFFFFTPGFPPHYLLGMTCITTFIIFLVFSTNRWGRILLILLTLYFFGQAILFTQVPAPTRSVTKIQNVADTFVQTGMLKKDTKIALVAVMDMDTSVPQADDYRYFLRVRGYNVLDVVNYSQAETLVMILEQPSFDWQHWSSWELDQFGPKKLRERMTIDGIQMLVFNKADPTSFKH